MTDLKSAIIAAVLASAAEIVCIVLWLGGGALGGAILFWPAFVLLYPAIFISGFLTAHIDSELLNIGSLLIVGFAQFFLMFWFSIRLISRFKQSQL